MTYTNARYSFTNPTPTRKYIKYLAQIAKCNANGFNPTRKQVQVALGDPDPTKPNDWNRKQIARCKRKGLDYKDLEYGCNWGNSRWAALQQAGLIRSERVGNTIRYQITSDGLLLLHSVV